MKTCEFCGNNPVPHRLYWYNETLNILLTPLRQKLLYNPLTKVLKNRGRDQSLAFFFLAFGEKLKIIRRQNSRQNCKVSRAQVLWEEAERRQIKMQELLLFGRGFDTYVAEKGRNPSSFILNPLPLRIIFSGLPRPLGYINPLLDLMDDKGWLKQILQKNKLPVAAGGAAVTFKQALEIFRRIEKPVIVKPRAGSRGRHSTTFVKTEQDLKTAFTIAKRLCYSVMVEEQLFGPVYRATVINFELAGVLRGDAPQVVGDGKSTIEQLVKIKNAVTHERVKDIKLDAGTEEFLQRQKKSLASILPNGEVVFLSEKVGLSYGGSSAEEFEICHSDNKQQFVEAAKILGDPLVGFDFIIPDITKSWKQQKCGFIEVNSLPFIDLHHHPLHGNPRNVAAKVWEMMGM